MQLGMLSDLLCRIIFVYKETLEHSVMLYNYYMQASSELLEF